MDARSKQWGETTISLSASNEGANRPALRGRGRVDVDGDAYPSTSQLNEPPPPSYADANHLRNPTAVIERLFAAQPALLKQMSNLSLRGSRGSTLSTSRYESALSEERETGGGRDDQREGQGVGEQCGSEVNRDVDMGSAQAEDREDHPSDGEEELSLSDEDDVSTGNNKGKGTQVARNKNGRTRRESTSGSGSGAGTNKKRKRCEEEKNGQDDGEDEDEDNDNDNDEEGEENPRKRRKPSHEQPEQALRRSTRDNRNRGKDATRTTNAQASSPRKKAKKAGNRKAAETSQSPGKAPATKKNGRVLEEEEEERSWVTTLLRAEVKKQLVALHTFDKKKEMSKRVRLL